MVSSPWSERKYYTSDVKLVPARRDSDPDLAKTAKAADDNNNKDNNMKNPDSIPKEKIEGGFARALAKQAAAAAAGSSGSRGRLPPPSPRASSASTSTSSNRAPSPVPMRGFDGSRSSGNGFEHDSKGSQFQPPARLSANSRTSSSPSSSSEVQRLTSDQNAPLSPRAMKQHGQVQAYLSKKQQSQSQSREPPASPSTRPIATIRDSWARRDREATESGIQSSTFRQAGVQQRSPSAAELLKQQQQQAQRPGRRPAGIDLPTLVSPLRSQSPAPRQQPSPRSASPSPDMANLSQTLNLQAEQLATMEMDYLNLISNLETEKRRVHDTLDARTKERDTVRSEVERLSRQLASKSNLTVQAEEDAMVQTEKIFSLEHDLQRCKEALAQRDDLISSRNTELEDMREAVCQAAEEKLLLQEQARVDGERRDKFQNGRLEKAMATVAEKDELIREKEVEIDELRVSFILCVGSL